MTDLNATREGIANWIDCHIDEADRDDSLCAADAIIAAYIGPLRAESSLHFLQRAKAEAMVTDLDDEVLKMAGRCHANGLAAEQAHDLIAKVAVFLSDQQNEPEPFFNMGERGHYWRNKCIEAALLLTPLSTPHGGSDE